MWGRVVWRAVSDVRKDRSASVLTLKVMAFRFFEMLTTIPSRKTWRQIPEILYFQQHHCAYFRPCDLKVHTHDLNSPPMVTTKANRNGNLEARKASFGRHNVPGPTKCVPCQGIHFFLSVCTQIKRRLYKTKCRCWFNCIWTGKSAAALSETGAIHSQLNWAILLCDVILDGKTE